MGDRTLLIEIGENGYNTFDLFTVALKCNLVFRRSLISNGFKNIDSNVNYNFNFGFKNVFENMSSQFSFHWTLGGLFLISVIHY